MNSHNNTSIVNSNKAINASHLTSHTALATPSSRTKNNLLHGTHSVQKEEEQQTVLITPGKEINKSSSFVRRVSSSQRSSSRNLVQHQEQLNKKRTYTISSLCLMSSLVFRLYAQWLSQGIEGLIDLISNATHVLCFCFVLHNVLYSIFPHCENKHVLAHYFIGALHQLCYIFSYLVNEELFLNMWNPIFIGYYMFTIILVITRPNKLPNSFKIYYTIHHSISFLVTGGWALVTCCPWDTYLLRGLALWLFAGFWSYCLSIHSTINPGIPKALFNKLRAIAFVIVQTFKMTAYVQGLIITRFRPSRIALIVLGTGFVIDLCNAMFVLRSIYRSYIKSQESKIKNEKTS